VQVLGPLLAALVLAGCGPNSGASPDGSAGDPGADACRGEGCASDVCGAAGVDLVYVVDTGDRLYSFDPTRLGTAADPFQLVGTLSCPAGPSWPTWPGGDPATPFSMSVDRDGFAWVLYTSGEIFRVSTANASCAPTDFAAGQAGFELFGMGFASDAPGSDAESLFIAGGGAGQVVSGDLGRIDPATLEVTAIGALPQSEHGPELTGTGEGELFGYYPGNARSFVARISRADAGSEETWELTPLSGDVRAWAFAHHGGRLYVFITSVSVGSLSRVVALDPEANGGAGAEAVELSTDRGDNVPVVVGAGVSTCAPIVIP
jgi:streptogramin lyase